MLNQWWKKEIPGIGIHVYDDVNGKMYRKGVAEDMPNYVWAKLGWDDEYDAIEEDEAKQLIESQASRKGEL